MVDDVEADEEGIVDVVLDDNAIRQVPRPGTSLRSAAASSGGPSQAYRPTTQSGKLSFVGKKILFLKLLSHDNIQLPNAP